MNLQDAAVLVALAIVIICHLIHKLKQLPGVTKSNWIAIPEISQAQVDHKEALTLWDCLDVSLPCPPSSILQDTTDPFYLPLAPWAGASVLPKVLIALPTREIPDSTTSLVHAAAPVSILIPAPSSPAPRRPPPSARTSSTPTRCCSLLAHPEGSALASAASPGLHTGQTSCPLLLKKDMSCHRGRMRRASLDVLGESKNGIGIVSSRGSTLRQSRLPSAPGSIFPAPSRPLAPSPTASIDIRRLPRSSLAAAKTAPTSPLLLRSSRQPPPLPPPAPSPVCKTAPACKTAPPPLPPPSPGAPLQHRTPRRRELLLLQAQIEVQRAAEGAQRQAQREKQHQEPQHEQRQRMGAEQLYQHHASAASERTCFATSPPVADATPVDAQQPPSAVMAQRRADRDALTDCRDPADLAAFAVYGVASPLRACAAGPPGPSPVLLRTAEFAARSRPSSGARIGGITDGGGMPSLAATPFAPVRAMSPRSCGLACSYDSSAFSYSSSLPVSSSLSLLSCGSGLHSRASVTSISSDGAISISSISEEAGMDKSSDCSNRNGLLLCHCAYEAASDHGCKASGVCSAGAIRSSGSVPFVSTSMRRFLSTGSSARGSSSGTGGKTVPTGISFLAFARATQMAASTASPPITPAKAVPELGLGMAFPKVAASPPHGKRTGKPNMPRIAGL